MASSSNHQQERQEQRQEGRGVINYDINQSSYKYSTSTTEFDDALIERGIISFEQAMIAKGASPIEAQRLDQIHHNQNIKTQQQQQQEEDEDMKKKQTYQEDDSDYDDDDSDDEFMKEYRSKRIAQWKKEKKEENHTQKPKLFGSVYSITRSDWNREVNDASQNNTWVIINITPSSSSSTTSTITTIQYQNILLLCQQIQNSIQQLAIKYPFIKFISISSNSAFDDQKKSPSWPITNLPTIFCYQNGLLQKQLIGIHDFGIGKNSSSSSGSYDIDRLEWKLNQLGILPSLLTTTTKKKDLSLIHCENDNDDEEDISQKFRNGMGLGLATGRRTQQQQQKRYDDDDISD